MFPLLNLFAGVCFANTHDILNEAALEQAPVFIHLYEDAIRQLNLSFPEFDISGRGRLNNAGAADAAVWHHDFLRLLHEKYVAAYRHVASIKDSARIKIFAEVADSLSVQGNNDTMVDLFMTASNQLLGNLPYNPIRLYDRTAMEVLYPDNSPSLRDAGDSYASAVAPNVKDPETKAFSSASFSTIEGSLRVFFMDLITALTYSKSEIESIADKCDSIPQARCCSVHIEIAHRFADTLRECYGAKFCALAHAIRGRDMASIRIWSSELQKEKDYVAVCFDVLLHSLKYRAAAIRKLNTVLLRADGAVAGNPQLHN